MPSARIFYTAVFDANGDVVDIDVAFHVQLSREETKRTGNERREVLFCGHFPLVRGVVRLAVVSELYGTRESVSVT